MDTPQFSTFFSELDSFAASFLNSPSPALTPSPSPSSGGEVSRPSLGALIDSSSHIPPQSIGEPFFIQGVKLQEDASVLENALNFPIRRYDLQILEAQKSLTLQDSKLWNIYLSDREALIFHKLMEWNDCRTLFVKQQQALPTSASSFSVADQLASLDLWFETHLTICLSNFQEEFNSTAHSHSFL